ncbi:hypothetical protein BGX38DRAFT_1167083 [Terfezia claveryi]|nr:hypothetical protein BGX38DRAFT_1167083 [Terfezia claveryi]
MLCASFWIVWFFLNLVLRILLLLHTPRRVLFVLHSITHHVHAEDMMYHPSLVQMSQTQTTAARHTKLYVYGVYVGQ